MRRQQCTQHLYNELHILNSRVGYFIVVQVCTKKKFHARMGFRDTLVHCRRSFGAVRPLPSTARAFSDFIETFKPFCHAENTHSPASSPLGGPSGRHTQPFKSKLAPGQPSTHNTAPPAGPPFRPPESTGLGLREGSAPSTHNVTCHNSCVRLQRAQPTTLASARRPSQSHTHTEAEAEASSLAAEHCPTPF